MQTSKPVSRLADIMEPGHNSFGLIRLLAAAAVALSHNMAIKSGALSADPVYGLTGYSMGSMRCTCFFVLSGLLVAASLSRASALPDFIIARLLRIYPGFAACTVLVAFVLAPMVSTRTLAAYFSDPGVASYVIQTLALITAKATASRCIRGQPCCRGSQSLGLDAEIRDAVLHAAGRLGALGVMRSRLALPLVALGCVVLACTYLKTDLVVDDSALDNTRRFTLCFLLVSWRSSTESAFGCPRYRLGSGACGVLCFRYAGRRAYPHRSDGLRDVAWRTDQGAGHLGLERPSRPSLRPLPLRLARCAGDHLAVTRAVGREPACADVPDCRPDCLDIVALHRKPGTWPTPPDACAPRTAHARSRLRRFASVAVYSATSTL